MKRTLGLLLASLTLGCARVSRDARTCSSTATGFLLHVERRGGEPPLGTTMVARCLERAK